MRQSSHSTLALLRRIRDFLARTQPTFALGRVSSHLAALSGVADELATLLVEQDTRRGQGKAGTATLHRRLRATKLEYMRPMAREARALFPDDPQLRSAFALTARLRRPDAVLAALHAMSVGADPVKERFVTAGFAADFLERMHAAADGVQEAVDTRAREHGRRSAAAAGARHTAARGRALVSRLDAMLAPRLESDPELLAEWRSLRRQGRVGITPAQSATPGVLAAA